MAYGDGLENRCALVAHLGFKSLSLRHFLLNGRGGRRRTNGSSYPLRHFTEWEKGKTGNVRLRFGLSPLPLFIREGWETQDLW